MQTISREPTLNEMQTILEHTERCLTCRAAACNSDSPCYEFTPGGVELCSAIVMWNGKPVLPETLRHWQEIVISYQAVPHQPDID